MLPSIYRHDHYGLGALLHSSREVSDLKHKTIIQFEELLYYILLHSIIFGLCQGLVLTFGYILYNVKLVSGT
jgi:hypothetical protein